MRLIIQIILVFLEIILIGLVKGQEGAYLSAKDSETKNFGWMKGFPPQENRVLSTADGSFFQFPALRWSVVHMRELLPTQNVSRGLEAPMPFEYALDSMLDNLTFLPWNSDDKMTWEESLWKNYTDGILVIHKGKIVYERYFSELAESNVHAVMSLTKSFTGTLASILVADGRLEEDKMVSFYVPELQSSAFGDATIRQLMDMTTALKYSENYADPKADVWEFSAAGNPLPKPSGYKGPIGYYKYLETVKKQGVHGEIFGYKTVNSDALGWVISRATGKSVTELLSEMIWSNIGMEQDAYYQVDALATPFAGGGLNAGLRDLGRFGELIRNRGMWRGKQILPMEAVIDIEKGGDKVAFSKSGNDQLKGWSYRNMWWITGNQNKAFMGRGVHGQAIYIDPKAEMVIVRLASHPIASNAANDPISLPSYEALANYFLKK